MSGKSGNTPVSKKQKNGKGQPTEQSIPESSNTFKDLANNTDMDSDYESSTGVIKLLQQQLQRQQEQQRQQEEQQRQQ